MDQLGLFLVFLKASALSFGGLQSLPLVRQDLVATGIATDAQVIEALAIGRLSPGPNGLYIVSLGYEVAGWLGAASGMLAASLPPLLIIPALALARRWFLSPRFLGAIRGVALGTGGLLAATGLQIVAPGVAEEGFASIAWWQGALAVASIALTMHGRIHPALLVVAGAVLGNVFVALGL